MEALWSRARSSKEATFEKDVESPDGTGRKSCLSNPIDDMNADRFWTALEEWLFKKGVLSELFEQEYSVTRCEDGGVLGVTRYGSAGTYAELIGGKFEGTVYMKYYFAREKNEMRAYNYNTDDTLSEKSKSQEFVLKVWPEPFRLEFYINELEARLCGPFAKAVAGPMIATSGLHVELFCNMDSPSEPGEKSILSSPIEDPYWSFQGLWDFYKSAMIKEHNAQEFDENMLAMEINMVFTTWYYSICLVDDGTKIVTRNHDTDETLCECKWESWLKVIENPTRLEIWTVNMPNRESGMKAQFFADTLMNATLRYARGESLVLPEYKTAVADWQKGIESWKESERQKEQQAAGSTEGAATEGSGAAEDPAAAEGTEGKSPS